MIGKLKSQLMTKLVKQEKMEKTMKFLKYLLPCALAVCGFAASMHADDDGYSTTVEERERDISALSDFVKTKGAVSILDKGGNLMLSGDVRFEWYYMHAKNHHNDRLRGHGSSYTLDGHKHPPFPTSEFDVEANLILEYRTDNTWAKIQWEFDNPAGIRERSREDSSEHVCSHKNTLFGSGRVSNIALRKAYMGYNICEEGTTRFDFELGRRRLYDVYDSKVEFSNYFDGLTLRYMTGFEGCLDFGVKASAFVINQNVNHWGYVGELDFLNIADCGWDFKYSYIHWDKQGVNIYDHKHPRGARFNVSQFLLAYNLPSDWSCGEKTQIYGAYLINTNGHKHHWFRHDKRSNQGFYVGVSVGEIRRKCDWAVDVNYQYVQAHCVPEQDVSGIGRDNPRNISLYRKKSGGFANYRGYKITALYAMTDNWTWQLSWEQVREAQKKIGGKHRSFQFELAAIYAF